MEHASGDKYSKKHLEKGKANKITRKLALTYSRELENTKINMEEFDREKFEEELKELGVEYDPNGFKPDLLTRLLLRISPMRGFKRLNRSLGVKNDKFDKAHELFSNTKSIDIFPLNSSSGRGFMIVLDRDTALYFYQDGDHFKYDGFEMGKYEKET